MNRQIDVTDYLLGELDPESHARAERLEREDPDFRREVERLRPIVSGLEGLPHEAWETDTAGLAEDPAAVRTSPAPAEADEGSRVPAPSRRRLRLPRLRLAPRLDAAPRLRLPLPAAIAAAAVLLGLGVAVGTLLERPAEEGVAPDEAIALEPLPGAPGEAGGEARVSYGEDGRAELRLSGLPPNRGSDFYELWLLNGPDDLVSLGSFKVSRSGEARLKVPVPAEPGRYGFLDISREPGDGDPSHSGDSVLRSPV